MCLTYIDVGERIRLWRACGLLLPRAVGGTFSHFACRHISKHTFASHERKRATNLRSTICAGKILQSILISKDPACDRQKGAWLLSSIAPIINIYFVFIDQCVSRSTNHVLFRVSATCDSCRASSFVGVMQDERIQNMTVYDCWPIHELLPLIFNRTCVEHSGIHRCSSCATLIARTVC
jgi:hypothetical protein